MKKNAVLANGRNAAPVTNTAPAPTAPAESTEDSGSQEGGDSDGEGDKPAEQPAEPAEGDGNAPATTKVNPFAELPVITATVASGNPFQIQDLRKVEDVANPRKYAAVHAAAVEQGAHMKPNWKHSTDVFKIGSNRNDRRAGSVMGNIQQIVKGYGAEGCPAPALVARLRTMSYDNSRSHFCGGKLPPVGWAEGYVQGAINDGLIKVSGKIQHDLVPTVAAPAAPATDGATDTNAPAEQAPATDGATESTAPVAKAA